MKSALTARLAWTATCLMAAAPAFAQSLQDVQKQLRESRPSGFPDRPLELVVTYPAGGGMDITARILAKYLEKYIQSPVLVMNRAGAAGLVGATYLATQAKPDGYTVGILASNFWGDAMLRAEGKFDYRDMEPIAFINYDPITWLVHTEGPFGKQGLQEIIAAARANPGAVRAAATEASPSGFLVQQIEAATGAKFTTVMYQGGRQAVTDLLGQHIEVSYGYLGEYKSQLEAGRVRTVGVASPQRVRLLKDTPTFNEVLGTDDTVWDAFRFAAVPKGTPADRKAWLEAAFNAALSDPAIAAEYAELGSTVDRNLGTARLVAEEIDRRVARERAFHVKVGRLKN
jgi:tripartite-type tricarboxylate transporter receptor subunit TctC